MSYTAKFFGGPTHGRVSDIPEDTQSITVKSWIDPIMPYDEWAALEVKTLDTVYLRQLTLSNWDNTPLIGYFFPKDTEQSFIDAMMNLEFAPPTLLYPGRKVEVRDGD